VRSKTGSISQDRGGQEVRSTATLKASMKPAPSPRLVRKSRPTAQRSVVAYLPVESLIPEPNNPRKHTPAQIGAIARSIDTFGFAAPILADKENRVVAGHGRLEAAKLLCLAEVPVIRLEHLSEQQAKAYMLADNKLTDRSSWDDRQVAIALKELSDIALDFEIEATGFEPPEIDLRIQSLEPPEAADAADEFETSEGEPVSRFGDLWILGPHRLLCGSASDSHAYGVLLDGAKAAAVFTDPPYNVRVNERQRS
jgi:ParB-like nuclease domain